MIAQQAGLDVGAQFDAVIEITLHEAGRIGEFLPVPVEHVTLRSDRRIARGEVEGVAQNVVLAAPGDELVHAQLGVGCVGVGHGRAGITEPPARRKGRPAGQPGETSRHLGRRAASDEVVIQIAVIGLEIAVMPVIVVQFLAHIQGAVGQGVVEQAEGQATLLFPGQVKGNVLVQRVGSAGAIPHRVDVAHAVALTIAVGVTRTLAEPEILLVPRAREIVINLVVPPAKVVALRWAVRSHLHPAVGRWHFPTAEESNALDGQAQARRGNDKLLIGFAERIVRRREARRIEAVAPVDRNIVRTGRDRPGPGKAQPARARLHQDTEEIRFKHKNMDDMRGIAGKGQVIALPFGQRKPWRIG